MLVGFVGNYKFLYIYFFLYLLYSWIFGIWAKPDIRHTGIIICQISIWYNPSQNGLWNPWKSNILCLIVANKLMSTLEWKINVVIFI